MDAISHFQPKVQFLWFKNLLKFMINSFLAHDSARMVMSMCGPAQIAK